jgi:prepilin-type N-terminal cleavage/methylation domain-containing protein
MTTQQRRHVRGMSLIEVMIAAALLGIGLTAVLSSFGVYTRLVARQRHYLEAAFVAQSTLQRLQSVTPTHFDIAAGAHPDIVVNSANEADAAGGYIVSWTVTPGKPTPRARLISVRVVYFEDAVFTLEGVRP